MVKRFILFAIVLAAVLVVAAPALAFNGARADYTPSDTCKGCHQNMESIPQVYDRWAETKHAGSNGEHQNTSLPYGSVCAGCHTGNYDPGKVVPTPTATSSTGTVSWVSGNVTPDTAHQADGDSAMSELAVGCSSCHQSQSAAHAAPQANLADPDICGQCHSRYSYTVDTYTVPPVPYRTVDANGSPVPNPSPTTLIQPQMAIGYAPIGNAAGGWVPAALTTSLNIPAPGWTPTPVATAAGFAKLQTFWTVDGATTRWQQVGHDGSAAQYPEWASSTSGHAQALTGLTSQPFWGSLPEATKQGCLECHSADFRISKEAGNSPTSTDARYGVTCVGCHTPHDKGTVRGVWWDELDSQLVGDTRDVCTNCHNGEIPAGKSATPGSAVHHPMKEMMDGYGAVDVTESPSVHKGKCIQCHMPPTAYNGSLARVQRAGNHTFEIIMPDVAAAASPITVSASPTPITKGMPYSACSTCHGAPARPNETPDPHATYLQPTIDQRQAAMHRWNDQVTAALTTAAKKLGFKSTAAANAAINKKPMKKWTKNQLRFQKAYTNQSYIASEGSWGIHNWGYARTIVLTALSQAKSVTGR